MADRVAQTAVTMVLEPLVEPHFHPDSYAYRPGRSALDAPATVEVAATPKEEVDAFPAVRKRTALWPLRIRFEIH